MRTAGTNLGNLKKELTLPMVFCIALKQVIGGGVIALTGVAIGMTGAGVPVAFLLAAVTSLMAGIPYAILSSAMPVTGGTYTWPTRLISPMTGFLTLWLFFLSNFSLSLYALTVADYIRIFYAQIPTGPLAFSILTVFYLLNLSGAKSTAKIGMVLTLVMASAILLFVIVGLPAVHLEPFANLTPHGVTGLLSAAGLLLFTTGGAAMVGELGGEMKRPNRDIPIAIIGATVVAALVYILTSIVAAGVLPLSEVAGKPLNVVAEKFMGQWTFLYFSVGAGIISVLGIINAQMLWGSKSLLVACDDNWLPRKLASVNKRFGTPHYLLTALYLLGVFPIVIGIGLEQIAVAATVTSTISYIVVVISCFVLYRKYPSIYSSASFKIRNRGFLYIIIASAISLCGFLIVNLFILAAGYMTMAIMGGWLAIGVVVGLARRKFVVPNTVYGLDVDTSAPSGSPSLA